MIDEITSAHMPHSECEWGLRATQYNFMVILSCREPISLLDILQRFLCHKLVNASIDGNMGGEDVTRLCCEHVHHSISSFRPIFSLHATCERNAIKNENQWLYFQVTNKSRRRRRRRIKFLSYKLQEVRWSRSSLCRESTVYYTFAYRFNEKNSYPLHAS